MIRLAALLALPLAASAMAVGLGPLKREGIIDGPGKAFYLTLLNPYDRAERFTVDSHLLLDETAAPGVTIFPASTVVPANGRRQLLVIVRGLSPGETRTFRVCAQRPPNLQETIHARVCSTLSARRLAGRRPPDRDLAPRPGLGVAGT